MSRHTGHDARRSRESHMYVRLSPGGTARNCGRPCLAAPRRHQPRWRTGRGARTRRGTPRVRPAELGALREYYRQVSRAQPTQFVAKVSESRELVLIIH